MWGIMIPVVAILATFAVPIVAIIMDYRRRQLQFEERRAMIERGMQPPPLQERERDPMGRTPEERRQKSLRIGILMLFLGIGLGLAAFLLGYVLHETVIPAKIAGAMAVGASVVGFIGLGNLVYFAVSGKQGGAGGAAG